MGARRTRRDALLGSLFVLVAVLGIPLLAGMPALLERAPVGGPLGRLLGPLRELNDERGLRNVEGRADLIREAAVESGVPPLLLGAIMFAESRGRAGQRSPAGALGLLQLMPSAARDAARRLGAELPEDGAALEQALLEDERLNVRLGAAHLRWLLDHQGDWTLEAVLVSYNAGRSRLFGWIEAAGGYPEWVQLQEQRWREGLPTSGALDYARVVLRAREQLRQRGVL